MQKILVSLDGTDFRRQIIPHIQKLFSPDKHELIFLRVARSVHGLMPEPPQEATSEFREPGYRSDRDMKRAKHPIYEAQVRDSAQSDLEAEMRKITRPLKEAGYKTFIVVKFSDEPSKAILNCVTERKIDMVAMTTHGRAGLTRMIFGNVAEKVLHKLTVPVMLLRPVDKAKSK